MPLKLHQDELPTINLTSMIDILFLLIIFFMVGTNFGMPEGHLAINLPKVSSSSSSVANEKKVVEVLANGIVYLDGQRTNLAQLTQNLNTMARQRPNLTVVFRGAKEASWGDVLEAMNAANVAGVRIDVAGTKATNSIR